jgi:16S rRNA (cytidine1402-2'-O)-methyltransferase
MSPLVLCGTPIGNLEDSSARLIRTLKEADVIACEDTRRARKLLSHHGINAKRLVTYNDQNERRRAQELVGTIERGETVALISDAGMPGLSDPGYRLVRACIDADLPISVVPGPSASISAVAISGLPPARFVFEGFLPRKKSDRLRRLEELRGEQRTVVFYESPHRVEQSLADMVDVFGSRSAALVRELTKMFEEVRRGTLEELLDSVKASPPKGEIVVVLGGAVGEARVKPSPESLAARARELMARGIKRKDALAQVASEAGVSRRDVFDSLLGD